MTLELRFEEVIVPFGSCHEDLGGKMASPTTGLCQPLCVGRLEGAMGTGGQGGQVVLGSCGHRLR